RGGVGGKIPDHCGGGGGDLDGDPGRRGALAVGRKNHPQQPTRNRKTHDQRTEHPRLATAARRKTAYDRTQKDCDKSRTFHKRVGGGQLLSPQVVREDPVFYWAKKRRENTEAEQRNKQERQ